MILYRRILLPTDFSKYAAAAVPHAASLAEKFGSELHLLNVALNPALVLPDELMAAPAPLGDGRAVESAARLALDRFGRDNLLEVYRLVKAVRVGSPAAEIVAYAAAARIDVIVMGTHGHSGLTGLLLGNVADKVVHHAPCPVLTVRPHAPAG